MKGKKGFWSLFALDDTDKHVEENNRRRRRRHSSGDRDTWSRKIEYILSCLGYAVGLGNFWRFPYLCYRNGGGAFLIPYIFFLCVGGIPVLMMEMGFGQFASLGTITIWRISPLFKGIGLSIITILILINTYYNVVIAYTLFYFFASITSELPWKSCDNKWNTANCIITRYVPPKANVSQSASNGAENLIANFTVANGSSYMALAQDRKLLKTPTEEFFELHVLGMSEGIEDLGEMQWPLIVCLAVSWFVCFMCLFKGIKSMGKAVYVTTGFSYVILTVLLIRGVTLPGSLDGLIFYLRPEWEKLKQLQVWGEAASQMFASMSLGIGGWLTLASYSKFNNKFNRDAIIVGIANALTSIYGGFVIFSVLGFIAHKKGLDVKDVVNVGPGLVFVVYPEGIGMMPGAPFWAICFFFLMFSVGLDSLFGQVETIAAGITDEFPELLRPHRKLFTLFLCIFMGLLGLPLVTQGGIYVMTLMDWYVLLMSFLIISFFEIVVLMYIYGFKRFAADVTMMTGSPPSKYFIACWVIVTPILIVIVIAFLSAHTVPPFYGTYKFGKEYESIGWALALGPLLFIPLGMVYQFIRIVGIRNVKRFFTDRDFFREMGAKLIQPSEEWGPALPEIRRRYSLSLRLSQTGGADMRGAQGDIGEDDVFGEAPATEMSNMKNPDHAHVKFEDEVLTCEKPSEEIPDVVGDEKEPLTGEEKNKANDTASSSAVKS